PFTPDDIARIESNMRAQAPWMNFAPFIYYPQFHNSDWSDLVLTLDSMVYFFRNQKRSVCIGPSPEGDQTVNNEPDEIEDNSQLLPENRNMLLGIYFVGLSSSHKGCPTDSPCPPSVPYDYNLAHLALQQRFVGSAVAYGLQTPQVACDNSNYLQDRF